MSLTPVAPFSWRKVAITPCSRRLERSQALWQRVGEQLGHVLRKSEARMSKPETNPTNQIVQAQSVPVRRALAFAIWRTEDVVLRRQHHVIEVLGEHCRREKCDSAQRFFANVDQVVPYRRGNGKNAAGPHPVRGTVFHVQFSLTGDNVLCLFGRIGVPAEPFSRLNLVHNRRRCSRAVSAIHRKCASPVNRLVIFSPDFSAFQFIGCNNGIHTPMLGSDSERVNGCSWPMARRKSVTVFLSANPAFAACITHTLIVSTRGSAVG